MQGQLPNSVLGNLIYYEVEEETKTSSLLVLFSHWGDFFLWLRTRDPQFSHVVARACKIRVPLRR